MAAGKVTFNGRLRVLLALAGIAGAVIALRLADIQLLRHDRYLQLAERNRTQVLYQTAPRGRIFTADGKAVAANAPSFDLYYLSAGPKEEDYLRRLAADFAPHLGVTQEDVLDKLQQGVKSGKAVALAENLSPKTAMALKELQLYYPGLYLIEENKRIYPYGIFASHLIGYLGSMEGDEWKNRDQSLDYRLDAKIGKNGLEKKFEKELKGRDGGVFLEVDYRGRVRSVIEDRRWRPGGDIYLTLNFDVQRAAEEGLKNSITGRGAAVALDPRTGAVLALATAPAFDPGMFVPYSDEPQPKSKRISEYNLATQGVYPPASTFKVITAIAAIEQGGFDPEKEVYCPGYYDAGSRVFKCWSVHKHDNFFDGMADSCDVYFYTLAAQTGSAAIEKTQRMFQFGQPTGIDLPGEKAGNLYGPTKRARNRSYWFIGDTLNLSIGQGELLVTPIKMAQFAAALASRGKIWRPYYLDRVVSNQTGKVLQQGKSEVLGTVDIRPSTWDLIYKALKHTVDDGTARRVKIAGLDVYGKTGTAQNPHGDDHGWFMAFAGRPGEEPSLAVAVFVEYGKGGAGAAGPIAREMIKAYFGIEDKPARRPVSAQQAVLENADPAALVSDMQKLQAALQRPDGEHT
ncbi:MAG TPA: penicillin-binding protein 2 [Candidatus Avelusimicrobium excrementipullorum]|nr:penicillin-binding protein 2 [Candidatus Avelusimicrobium excrementipullorum]